MFTGIIEAVGQVSTLRQQGMDTRLSIDATSLNLDDVALGDSIAVSGVCLTVTALTPSGFAVDVSSETLDKTTVGQWRSGAPVNLEKALRLSDRLGGHLVSGHVDGVAEVVGWQTMGESMACSVRVPSALLPYIACKGSVCVDGISLTVNAIHQDGFDLCLIPHTLVATTAQSWRIGQRLNLEVDLIARYLERLRAYDPRNGS